MDRSTSRHRRCHISGVQRAYLGHLTRVVLSLGTALFLAAVVSLAAGLWREVVTTAPENLQFGAPSLSATFSQALALLPATLPVIAALLAVPLVGAQLLHQLHATEDLSTAHSFLNRLVFGPLGPAPGVLAREGHVTSADASRASPVRGPAALTIHSDTAVVTERGGRLGRVLGPSRHALQAHETVWETLDLRTQRWVHEVSALTKEGIPVSCDVDLCFRICASTATSHESRTTPGPPQRLPRPGSEETVLRAAAAKWIRAADQPTPTINWAGRVVTLAENALRDILATYRLDWLIRAPQPDQPHPRDQIRRRLKAELEDSIGTVGAELLEIELGNLQVKVPEGVSPTTSRVSRQLEELVSQQWVDAWDADWHARAVASRAEGEAELLRIDAARVQAQAETVIALAEALQPVLTSPETAEPYVLALQVVEALHWMSYDPDTRDFMPPEAMRTLKRLQDLLDSEAVTPRRDRGHDSEGSAT